MSNFIKEAKQIRRLGNRIFKAEHSFTADHIEDGLKHLFRLNRSVENIVDECINLIKRADAEHPLNEGLNVIRHYIDSIPVEIRFWVESETLVYFNFFAQHSGRFFSNIIEFIN